MLAEGRHFFTECRPSCLTCLLCIDRAYLSPTLRPAKGSRQAAVCRTASREFHPNCQSHPHCLRLWLGGSTIVIMTVIAAQRANWRLQRVFSLGPIGQGHGVPCCCGSCFRTSELMYLTNGYSVIKEHREGCDLPNLYHDF